MRQATKREMQDFDYRGMIRRRDEQIAHKYTAKTSSVENAVMLLVHRRRGCRGAYDSLPNWASDDSGDQSFSSFGTVRRT